VYHFAEQYAQRFGIVAKVLISVRDAKDWLALDERHKSASGLSGGTITGTVESL